MKKFVKLIALALIVAVLTVSAAFADSTARTLDEIKESGTLTVAMWTRMAIIRATTCTLPAVWRRISARNSSWSR